MNCNSCGKIVTEEDFTCPQCFTVIELMPEEPAKDLVLTGEGTLQDSINRAKPQELLFVKALLGNGGNTLRAAMSAGYSYATAKTTATTWVRVAREDSIKPWLWDIYQHEKYKLLDLADITNDRIEAEIARLAFFDVSKMFDRNGNVLPLEDMDEDTRRAIGSLDIGSRFAEDGMLERVLRVKTSEKLRALDLYTKIRGMNVPTVKVEHSFTKMLNDVTDEAAEEPLVMDAEFEEVDDVDRQAG